MTIPKELAAFAKTTPYSEYDWQEAPTTERHVYSYDDTSDDIDTLTTKIGTHDLVLQRITGPNAPKEGNYYFGVRPGENDLDICYWLKTE